MNTQNHMNNSKENSELYYNLTAEESVKLYHNLTEEDSHYNNTHDDEEDEEFAYGPTEYGRYHNATPPQAPVFFVEDNSHNMLTALGSLGIMGAIIGSMVGACIFKFCRPQIDEETSCVAKILYYMGSVSYCIWSCICGCFCSSTERLSIQTHNDGYDSIHTVNGRQFRDYGAAEEYARAKYLVGEIDG